MKKPMSPEAWQKLNPPRSRGVQCWLCGHPQVAALAKKLHESAWNCEDIARYLKSEHEFPRTRNSISIHLRNHVR